MSELPYIIRVNLGRVHGVHYGTINPMVLDASYVGIYRRKADSMLSEQVGQDKSKVNLHFRTSDRARAIVNERGHYGLMPGNTSFKLLDRHKHIRRLLSSDQAALAQLDKRIAAKRRELEALRDQRADSVAAAWRRAEKVGIDELEEAAEEAAQ